MPRYRLFTGRIAASPSPEAIIRVCYVLGDRQDPLAPALDCRIREARTCAADGSRLPDTVAGLATASTIQRQTEPTMTESETHIMQHFKLYRVRQ